MRLTRLVPASFGSMAKSYEVLHDTWLRGRRYASGSQAVLGDEDAAGYARAGLIKGDVPVAKPEPQPEPEVEVELEPLPDLAPEPTHEKSPKKKKHSRD